MARRRSWWSARAFALACGACVLVVGAPTVGGAKASEPTPDPAFQGDGGSRVASSMALYYGPDNADDPIGWLVAGHESDDAGYTHPAFWISSKFDGGWSRVDDSQISGAFSNALGPDASGRAVDSTTHGLTSGSYGYVAVGSATDYQQDANQQEVATGPVPALWFSPDQGASWKSSLLPMPDGGKVAIAESVTSTDGRYVAVGTVSTDDQIGGAADRPVAWYSDDAVTWKVGSGMIGSVSGETKAFSVANGDVGSSSEFLAAGGSVTGDSEDAAAWTSSDGITWTKVANSSALGKDSTVRDQEMQGVRGLAKDEGGGFLAVGDESDNPKATSRGVMWRSKDGTHWTRTAASTFTSNDSAHPSVILTSCTFSEGHFEVVGEAQSNKNDSTRAVAWTSTNANKWTKLHSGDGSDKVQSTMLYVKSHGPNYEIVGALRNDANNWNGKN